jgi:hypothetical protein
VLSDGRVSPCPQDFFGGLALGRADESSLQDIWHGPAARRLRVAHATGDLSGHAVCRACDRPFLPRRWGLPAEHLHNFWAESIIGLSRARTAPVRPNQSSE